MIETREAIENLDSILDLEVLLLLTYLFTYLLTYLLEVGVLDQKSWLSLNLNLQGLDGAFLGPSDLSISLGVPTDLGLPKCQYSLARWHVLSLSLDLIIHMDYSCFIHKTWQYHQEHYPGTLRSLPRSRR